jgi:hypothetical protein
MASSSIDLDSVFIRAHGVRILLNSGSSKKVNSPREDAPFTHQFQQNATFIFPYADVRFFQRSK